MNNNEHLNSDGMYASSKEKLIQDCKIVVSDAEELLKATAAQAGEKVSAARVKVQESLQRARTELDKAEAIFLEKAKEASQSADQYVRENPWQAVGISAGVALIVGLLIGRR